MDRAQSDNTPVNAALSLSLHSLETCAFSKKASILLRVSKERSQEMGGGRKKIYMEGGKQERRKGERESNAKCDSLNWLWTQNPAVVVEHILLGSSRRESPILPAISVLCV